MRVFRYLIIAAALCAAIAVAAKSTQDALRERDASRASSSPFGPGTASAGATRNGDAPSTTEARPASRNETSSATVTPPAPASTELSAAFESRIEEELRSWTFSDDDLEPATAFLVDAERSPKARRVAQWLLARTLVSTSDDARKIPDRLHEVRLKNGSVLHARHVTEEADAIALTTMTGIDAKLAAHKVEHVRSIDRSAYLRETGDDFRERIDRLDRTRPSDLETALEESLRRGHAELARDLFHDWIDAGGAMRLAGRFSERKRPELHRAAELLTDGETSTVIATSTTPPAAAADSLENLDDLGQNIDRAYRALARKTIDRDELQKWIDRVSSWEEWLERRLVAHPGRDSKATVDDLRQRLQHLRLDLLKKTGF